MEAQRWMAFSMLMVGRHRDLALNLAPKTEEELKDYRAWRQKMLRLERLHCQDQDSARRARTEG